MTIWIIATLIAFYIKGLCGFANTLVFTSILAFGTTNINISPVELILGYPTNLILTWKNRNKLNKAIFIPLSILVLIGSIIGAVLLKKVNPGYIKIVFGIIVVLIGTEILLREFNKLQLKESKIFLGVIGVLSGVLCGLFGVGALLAAYIGRVSNNSEEFKANISAVFIVENSFRIILYIVLGIFTLSGIKQAIILFPFMLIGLFLGIKSSKILNEKTVKILVIVLLIISGVMMVVNNI
ncbi:sulfite exporter TauE/SafE family protein [Butyrivibrio sp. XB500-5]|uniref:sulfite exporter TauE/SafE family protein n=1 Tax=Butyrivibrio sp. XB500-5 TaxID=2364880 RepID=UPI000EAA9D1C|nr:sulfite exporter TauE/SafE family protein [Butyrivibrio sp. XB500-5]RKM63089.1 sulfite exporter TauE/SafE family protein [Butyrivibrio sp. XB500-5]